MIDMLLWFFGSDETAAKASVRIKAQEECVRYHDAVWAFGGHGTCPGCGKTR